MRRIHIIGIGAGDPDHVTIQAIKALNEVDVFFMPDKGQEKEDLRRLRFEVCRRYVDEPAYRVVDVELPKRDRSLPYAEGVDAWHAAIEARYDTLIREHLAEDECGGFLVWGDPGLYDSTLRIVRRIHAKGLPLDYDVIPGISSVQALAARHRVPLNRIGEAVAIVPGRRLEEAIASGVDSLVVVLDGEQAYRRIGDDFDIFWGAYVGTPDECLVSGRLPEVGHEIDALRQSRREAKGWIMDSYLIRRRHDGSDEP